MLAVVLYHLQEGICPGGYAGVDIFFVISGYLIGGGLIRSLKEGTFSLTSFYLRRIRRIMPAYFCLIAAVLAFGCVVLDCDDLRTLGRTVRSSALSSPTLTSAEPQGITSARRRKKTLC